MPIIYNRIEKMEQSKNKLIKKISAYYKYYRKRSEIIIGKVFGFIFKVLPKRVVACIRDKSMNVVRMPYSEDIYIKVDAFRDISRANFPYAEPETVEWIEKYFKPDDVIYDVGANIGAVSLIAVAFLKKKCKVISFEPSFSTYKQLCENIAINNFQDVMEPFIFALSSSSGIDSFSYTNIKSGTSGHSLSGSVEGDIKYVLKQRIIKYSIDDLWEKLNFDRPNHIKIDVDGHDLEVLKGADKILLQGNVRSILIEKNMNESEIRSYMIERRFVEVNMNSRDNLLFVYGRS